MLDEEVKLAIVIPAYKTGFLEAALKSIAAQTNKNFNVYISDDGSKEDIKSIAEQFEEKFTILYHRFQDNAGYDNLVKHWNRSVELASEEWVWLFSDDDLMSPGCVQAFFNALDVTNGQHNLYRFNIEMINAEGDIICVKDPHPQLETGFDFLQRRLQSKSLSAAVEYVFKKETFDKHGGFTNFPKAYCSDDATWINFAEDQNIYTIYNEKVYWRASGINISSGNSFAAEKVEALLFFVDTMLKKHHTKQSLILKLAKPWFFENLEYIYGKITFSAMLRLASHFKTTFNSKTNILGLIIMSRFKQTRLGKRLNND